MCFGWHDISLFIENGLRILLVMFQEILFDIHAHMTIDVNLRVAVWIVHLWVEALFPSFIRIAWALFTVYVYLMFTFIVQTNLATVRFTGGISYPKCWESDQHVQSSSRFQHWLPCGFIHSWASDSNLGTSWWLRWRNRGLCSFTWPRWVLVFHQPRGDCGKSFEAIY